MRRNRVVAAAVGGMILAGVLPLTAYAETGAATATLGQGQSAFWNGTWAASGNVQSPSLCGTPAGDCWIYTLVLRQSGYRLRVALDHPVRSDTYPFSIYDSHGNQLASASTSDAFSAEAFVNKPAAGTYIVQVLPQGITDTTFRMRAKLEATNPAPPSSPKVMLLPHLRADPPYEFTFTAPANPANGLYPPDTANPPLEVAGQAPISCSADETATYGVQRCLRFTSGPVNEGAGPFEIDYNFVGDTSAQRPYTAYQVVHWSDGSVTTRPAGSYEFHYIHGHFHYDGILDYVLFKVTSPGHMMQVGAGFKDGFCPADELIGQWNVFNQQPAGTYNSGSAASGGNCFSFNNGVLGLSTGWGDVYRWQRPEQFVDFDGQTDGYYVVEAIADVDHNVLGTGTDNVSYAYIHVVGSSVDLLDRGFGTSPWDPHRQSVMNGTGGPVG